MAYVFELVRWVPAWAWPATVSAAAYAALVVMWRKDARRASAWELAARSANADARIWRSVAERAEAALVRQGSVSVFDKRTVVAPHFHSPRG
jgi:hypothetical protein